MSRVRRPRSPVADPVDPPVPRPITAAPSPTSLPQRIGFIAYAALALLWLAAGWNPDPRLWGVHVLGFLPRPVWFIALLGFALLAVPKLALRFASGWLRVVGWLLASWSRYVWMALVAGVAFYVFRLRFQFLGDGMVWLEKIENRAAFHHFEPLATVLVSRVAHMAAKTDKGAGWPSIACGLLYIVLTAQWCRKLWKDAAPRALAWSILLLHPAILLFFGYVESYPLLLVLQVAFGIALLGNARAGLLTATVVLAVAIATHLQAIGWLPALVAMAVTARSPSATAAVPRRPAGASTGPAAARVTFTNRRQVGLDIAVGAGASALAVALAIALVRAAGASPRQLLSQLGGESGFGGAHAAALFSSRRGIDLLNELCFVLGSVALVGLPAFLAIGRRALLMDPRWFRIVAFLVGPALFALVVVPRIGGARDWDLYLSIVPPTALLAVEAWRRWGADGAAIGKGARIVAGRGLGFALVTTLAWLAVNVNAERAANRLTVLQDPRGTFGNFARGYANETLGVFYRDRNLGKAREAYERATVNNPKNARFFNNLANCELRMQNIPAARDNFRRALDLGMKEWFVLQNLGVCEMQLHRPAQAESAFVELVNRWPDRWLGHACLAQSRLELGRPEAALPSIDRALELAPKQADAHYFRGLALSALGRQAEAREAFATALRLEPKHDLAARALESLPAGP